MPKLSQKIRELDLQCIACKALMDENLTIEQVDSYELGYRCFLQVIDDNPGMSIAPTREVDIFWHHHILDTAKYIDDCDRLFGRYIHHFPYSGILSDEDAQQQQERFQRSQQLVNAIA